MYVKHLNIIFIILIGSMLFSRQTAVAPESISNEGYIITEDGVVRIYINIIGHVKYPGNYLLYDGVDFMTALSAAGGYLEGADIKNISIYKKNGQEKKININNIFDKVELVNLDPNDTIVINQKKISKFFSSSNMPTIILSLLNLAITLDRTD